MAFVSAGPLRGRIRLGDELQCRWRFNVAIAVGRSGARKKSDELTIAIVPAETSLPAV
jgi:hypothetical protein